MLNTIVFVICICMSIHFGFLNIGKLIRGDSIPGPCILLMSIFLTGVITHIFGIC